MTATAEQELRDLDLRIAALVRRRGELLERVAAERAVALPAAAAAAGPPGAPGARAGRGGVQRLLLVSGVVLVATAAVGFAAVVVASVGVLGQALVLLALCAAAAAASAVCARRGLGASSEALAVLAVAVLVVVVAAAHGQGLFGLDAVDDDAWVVVGLVVVAAVSAGGAARLRHGATPRAYGWAAVSATALLPAALTTALGEGSPTWSATALALAVASAVATPRVRRHARGLATGVLIVGAAHLVAGLLTVLVSTVEHESDAALLASAVQVLLLSACAALVAARGAGGIAGLARVARTTAWAAAGAAALCLGVLGGPAALLALGAGLAVAAAAVLVLRGPAPWAALVTAQASGGLALLLEPVALVREGGEPTWARPAAWALLAGAAALTGAVRPTAGTPRAAAPSWLRVPAGWAAASAGAALLGAGLVPAGGSAAARTVALLVAAGAALALLVRAGGTAAGAGGGAVGGTAAGRPARSLEAVLVTAWATGTAVAVASAAAGGSAVPGSGVHSPEAVLALAGVEALALAVLPGRLAFRPVGAGLLVVAWWVALATRPGSIVEPLEWWTLPPAVLLLLAGALTWRRRPELSSWVVLGPGLVVGTALSAVLCLDRLPGDPVARPVVTVLAAAALCAVGAGLSWQAPLVVGALAGAVVALGQLGPYAAEVPLWASAGTAGALVLLLAVRLEQARRDAARAAGWVRALR